MWAPCTFPDQSLKALEALDASNAFCDQIEVYIVFLYIILPKPFALGRILIVGSVMN